MRARTTVAILDTADLYVWRGIDSPPTYNNQLWGHLTASGGVAVSVNEVANTLVGAGFDPSGKIVEFPRFFAGNTAATVDLSAFYNPPAISEIAVEGIDHCYIDNIDEIANRFDLRYNVFGSDLITDVSLAVIKYEGGVPTGGRLISSLTAAMLSNGEHCVDIVLDTIGDLSLFPSTSESDAVLVRFVVRDTYGDVYTYDKNIIVRETRDDEFVYLYYSTTNDLAAATIDISQRRGVPFRQSPYSGYQFFTVLSSEEHDEVEIIRMGDQDLCGGFVGRGTIDIGGTTYNAYQSSIAIEAVTNVDTIIL